MELDSTGQVSSLVREPTQPNAPAKIEPSAAAPAGGAPQNAPSSVVADTSADAGASNDSPDSAARDTPSSVDITV